MDQLNERNMKVGSISAAITVSIISLSVLFGNVLTSQATERENKQANVQLVECIKAGKTPTECRVLIYGSR